MALLIGDTCQLMHSKHELWRFENVPHRFWHLNTWWPVDGAVLEGPGDVASLERSLGQGSCVPFSAPCGSRCEPPVSCSCSHASVPPAPNPDSYPSGILNPNKLLLL